MHRSLVGGTVLVLAGCVHTNAAMLDEGLRLPPICSNAVRVYRDTAQVPKPYTEVALLNSKGESSYTSEGGMINSQRQKAAKLGANGLVVGVVQEPKAGTKIIGAIFGTGAERKGAALAVHVPADSARVTELCDGTRNRTATRS